MSIRFDAGEVITAMVTPMDENGRVDYDMAEKLAEHLISNGSDSILVVGTTGESPTLTHEEELELLSTVKRAVAGKAKVIVGAGSNSTTTAVEFTKTVTKEGADAILSVVPYYNKPSQEGIYRHFSAIAGATKLPVILYNIPSRTGINMEVATVKRLAQEFSNIVGLKQSSPDLDMVSALRRECPEDFVIYSGDDSLTLPMLSLGAYGVISVASHIYGNEIKTMIKNFKTGNVIFAKNMQMRLFPIFKKLFIAPNPVPIKAALFHKGIINDFVRLPLVKLNDVQRAELVKTLDEVDEN